jgi:hypothetical protein
MAMARRTLPTPATPFNMADHMVDDHNYEDHLIDSMDNEQVTELHTFDHSRFNADHEHQ